MAMNVRVEGDVVILSNFARLMNDPRHFDAGRDVRALLDQGYRHFVVELRGIGELGSSALGLITTITRLVRQHDGEVVLASVNRALAAYLDEMTMDAYWETFASVEDATRAFHPPS